MQITGFIPSGQTGDGRTALNDKYGYWLCGTKSFLRTGLNCLVQLVIVDSKSCAALKSAPFSLIWIPNLGSGMMEGPRRSWRCCKWHESSSAARRGEIEPHPSSGLLVWLNSCLLWLPSQVSVSYIICLVSLSLCFLTFVYCQMLKKKTVFSHKGSIKCKKVGGYLNVVDQVWQNFSPLHTRTRTHSTFPGSALADFCSRLCLCSNFLWPTSGASSCPTQALSVRSSALKTPFWSANITSILRS